MTSWWPYSAGAKYRVIFKSNVANENSDLYTLIFVFVGSSVSLSANGIILAAGGNTDDDRIGKLVLGMTNMKGMMHLEGR